MYKDLTNPELDELSEVIKSWLQGYDPVDDKIQHVTLTNILSVIEELLERRCDAGYDPK